MHPLYVDEYAACLSATRGLRHKPVRAHPSSCCSSDPPFSLKLDNLTVNNNGHFLALEKIPPIPNSIPGSTRLPIPDSRFPIPESADFVSAMESESKGKETRRSALDAAAAKHIQVAKAAAQGQGVDRHLYAMRAAAAEAKGQMGEEFFGDPLAAETAGWRLSTSNVSMPFLSSFG